MRWSPNGAATALSGWLAEHRLLCRRMLLGLAVVVVMLQWIRAVSKPTDGDFFLHWQFAERFASRQFLYADGLHIPYPPFWAMFWTPATALPMRIAKAACYPLGILALAAMAAILERLSRRHLPLPAESRFWCTALALALASRFVVRELPECGPNLLLLALCWLAIYGWAQRREWAAGTCLGLAIALKCTPALFLGWFAWKRQWRMAVTTVAATAVFTLAPAIWMGPVEYGRHMQAWFANVRLSGSHDPSIGPLGPEPVQNLSLRPAIARYLMHLPAGHPGRRDHPAYVDLANLSPGVAGTVANCLLVLLVALAAWSFRRPVERRHDLGILWECAAVSILALLLSPITWGQHCVALLPALYLASRTVLAGDRPAGWMNGLLAAYVLVNLVFNRGLVGRETALLLDSYHLPTITFLGLLAVTLGCRARAASRFQLSGPHLSLWHRAA